ncbi:YnbE family lipoprotein [Sphingomonas sp. FW199]|uniref:YnbE family lipoprotein n=1 Tax=Sphingomonas sp. FW199 TaxID=3400217 RepID=UPI003CF6D511
MSATVGDGVVPPAAKGKGRIGWTMMAAVAMAGLGGCITVNAPDKPIEINLNIKISQEIVYRFDGDAKRLIDENPGIF